MLPMPWTHFEVPEAFLWIVAHLCIDAAGFLNPVNTPRQAMSPKRYVILTHAGPLLLPKSRSAFLFSLSEAKI